MARLVSDSLRERGFDVFMDVEDLKSGQFDESLLREIELSTDVVVILSPGALDRCCNEGDWMAWEIRHAIACGKNVVPVRTRNFSWPARLPEELKNLPYFQGIEPSHELFNASMDKLVELLHTKPKRTFDAKTIAVAAAAVALVLLGIVAWRLVPERQPSRPTGIREIVDDDGWIQLFDGQTLSGWTAPPGSGWLVTKGILVGRGKTSHLVSPFAFTNLEFKADVRISHGGNSGMKFRAQIGRGLPGYEAQIDNTSFGKNVERTGSLWNLSPFYTQLVEDDTWFTMHIIAISNHIVIKVNDRIVTDYVDEKNSHQSGFLALQHLDLPRAPRAVVTFRNVVAKRLPSNEKDAWRIARKDMPDLVVPGK